MPIPKFNFEFENEKFEDLFNGTVQEMRRRGIEKATLSDGRAAAFAAAKKSDRDYTEQYVVDYFIDHALADLKRLYNKHVS